MLIRGEKWFYKLTKKELAIVEECEKDAKVRLVNLRRQLIVISNSTEQKGVHLTDLIDCTVTVSECVLSDFPNAYKYIPSGTVVTYKIEKNNRVRIISACRTYTDHRIEWSFTDKAKEAIININSKR